MPALKNEPTFNPEFVKTEFPALRDSSVFFMDCAASAQKPKAVIDAMTDAYSRFYANVHRGLYRYSQDMTAAFEAARKTVAEFLNAYSDNEVVFTKNSTEAINLFVRSWGRKNLQTGDEVILTALEHHANLVPWQMLRDEIGFTIKIAPIHDDGSIDMDAFEGLLTGRTKLVSCLQMSNALGTILPVKDMAHMAHEKGAKVFVDASQSVVHMNVDVQDMDCDFLCFTGHKLYGPTGIGILWGREDLLNDMPPFLGGGEMIETVTYDEVTFKDAPARFEAGTPPIVEALGLAAAINWLNDMDMDVVRAHENRLLSSATASLSDIDGVTIWGTSPDKASILSFTMDGVHPHDIGTIFDQMGVAVRAGHHCAQPLMVRLGVPATVRASFALYNTEADVARLVEAVHKVKSIFG